MGHPTTSDPCRHVGLVGLCQACRAGQSRDTTIRRSCVVAKGFSGAGPDRIDIGRKLASAVADREISCTYASFMTRQTPGPKRWRDPRAGVRVAVAASLGILAGGVVSLFTFWQAATLIGWDVGVVFLGAWIWWAVGRLSSEETRSHATREDTSIQLTELLVLAAGVAVLAAVGLALIRAGNATGGTKAYLITLGVVSVALSWGMVHTVFTLRYARTFYSQPVGGIDFNEEDPPSYLDFAYLALTIGMTFQVSDTNLTTKAIRRVALSHALLSYLFGAVIVALVINVVSSLLH
jgi:uncharacterized membrane protein